MMKRLFVIITFALLTIAAKAQISTCAYYDGYWGEWTQQYLLPLYSWEQRKDYYNLYGNYSGFIIYDKEFHPSQYCFKFQINNYVPPTKKQIKEHYKKKEWYEYSGTVEYYVVESEPTIKDVLKATTNPYGSGFPIYNHGAKRVANATIKIAPYKKRPQVYNFWFDDVGFAISLDFIEFNN